MLFQSLKESRDVPSLSNEILYTYNEFHVNIAKWIRINV